MQIRILNPVRLALDLLGITVVRSAAIAREGCSLAKDAVILSEGMLAWVSAISALGAHGLLASDVASDPLASPWDDAVRRPRSDRRDVARSPESPGHDQPAAQDAERAFVG